LLSSPNSCRVKEFSAGLFFPEKYLARQVEVFWSGHDWIKII
jgi:hypothetical protein